MKSKPYLITGAILLLTLSFYVGRWSTAPVGPHAVHDRESDPPKTWTCSMHPQIQQPSPGDCPICGMDLIPLVNADATDDGPRTLRMSESSRALADIQTTPIERRFPEAEIRLVGKLNYDETKVKSLTARFPARIDELFVNFTGVPVTQGDHLARVYSPELLTAQSELLSAYRYSPESSATLAAKEKLRLWDLLPEQIDSLLQIGQAKDHFELKAPISGIVVSKNINEGDYLKTGQSLFKIVDLNRLWLKLDAYESDLAWLRFGQAVEFSVEAYPGQIFKGQITFISPELDRNTRTITIRVNVPNTDNKLKPGMFAKAIVRSQVAQAGNVFAPEFAGKWISPMHPEIIKDAPGQCDVCGMDLVPVESLGYVQDPNTTAPLVVPASAVLRTGKRSVVYIANPNSEQATYEGREIEIGPRAGDVFIVISGLSENDRVVTNGAFKIDSALQILAKPSMMSPPGNSTVSKLSNELALILLPNYFKLQTALAADDLEAAKIAINKLHTQDSHNSPIDKTLHALSQAANLETIRRPHFEDLSNALIETINNHPETFEISAYQMHCPMVYPNHGADWLQSHKDLKNPYFGAAMLKCGEVKKEF